MSIEIVSLSVIVGAAVLLMLLERLFPYDPQRLLREGFFTDLVMYSVVQSAILGMVINRLIAWMDHSTGWSRYAVVSGWPVPAQCLFFFVAHDFYIYWFHRLQHGNRFLWRTHEAHHSVRDIDWVAGSRSHSLEILINQTIEFAPIALLGAAPQVAVFKATLDAVWGMWIHSNVDVRMGVLQFVFNGPQMHRWHHAQDLAPPGKNFATKIALWDWLFGTAHLPTHRKPTGYGLGAETRFPRNYFTQHAYAFRRFSVEELAVTSPDGAASTRPVRSGRSS